MTLYKSKSGKTSGVSAYATAADHIVILFSNQQTYKYSYGSAGKDIVEEMKMLADQGAGLSTFIAKHKPGFE